MVELQALNYVLQKKDSSFFRNYNICDDEFQTYHKEYKYIKDFIDKYGVTPDITTFTETFKDFPVTDVVDSPEFLSDKLLLEGNSAISIKTIGRALQLFREGKQKEGIAEVQLAPSKLISSVKKKPVNITDDTSRYDHYVEKTNNLNAFFTKTGFEELDEYLNGGWDRNEDVITIVARPGVGKSWVGLKMGLGAAMQGLRVGIYSGEMSVDKVAYRIDTLLGHVPNRDITHGNIASQAEYKAYIEDLPKLIQAPIFILTPDMLGGRFATISDLWSFIETLKLDLLVIDQHSLLNDEKRGKDAWTRASNISMDIKNLQLKAKIPIIAISQQNRGKDDDDTKDLDVSRISQSDRIGQDSSIVFFVQQDYNNNILTLTAAKVRDGDTGKKFKYAVDFNKGIFNYLPNGNENKSAGNALKAEYDGYDASQEDYDAVAGEDIF